MMDSEQRARVEGGVAASSINFISVVAAADEPALIWNKQGVQARAEIAKAFQARCEWPRAQVPPNLRNEKRSLCVAVREAINLPHDQEVYFLATR